MSQFWGHCDLDQFLELSCQEHILFEVGIPNWCMDASLDGDMSLSGVPEGKIKVRRGWVWEGVSPLHTLGKKNQNMN